MANETTTTSLNDFVDTMIADAIMQLGKVGVMPPKVKQKSLVGFPGKSVNFTKWDAITSSDVGGGTEGTDYTTNKSLTSSVVSGTVDEHLIMSTITDLSRDSSVEDIDAGAGTLLGNALAGKLDDDLVGLFSGFSQTVAGAGSVFSHDDIMAAVQYLKNANAPGPYFGVFHPKQIWGAKGFSSLIDVSAIANNSQSTPASIRMQETGEISQYAGINIDWSTEIDDDVASGDDAAGGIFSPAAIGLVNKGYMNVELERNASLRGYEIVVQGLWKEVEVVDTYGVYVLSDVS